jgi:signal transduction histidine kinase
MPGGGALVIATSKVRLDPIECRCHPDAHPGDYVSISFSDSGLGMDRGTLARIFEPFFTTKAPGQGTGLGLTIAHSIVRQNGGFLTVDSEPGRGSVFTIHLPAVLASSKRPVRGTLRPMACGPETALAV